MTAPIKYTLTLMIPKQLVSDAFVAALGSTQIANIRTRLQRGVGLDDAAMPQYSAKTKALRRARGRQTAVRDLADTGRMVGDMHVSEVRRSGSLVEAVITFATGEGRSKALSNQARAPWFGISTQDKAILIATVRQQVAGEIQENLKNNARASKA